MNTVGAIASTNISLNSPAAGKHVRLGKVVQEIADMFTTLYFLLAAEKIESAERSRTLKGA